MRTTLFILASLFCAHAQGQLTINLGTAANDGTGDNLRSAGIKINTNFFAIFSSNLQAIATFTAADVTTSNGAVGFSMTVSNDLANLELTRNAAVSNANVAFSMTVSNAIATFFQAIDTELTQWSGISTNKFLTTNHVQNGFISTNGVKVVDGTGVTVTGAASGSAPDLVHTFTVNAHDDASSFYVNDSFNAQVSTFGGVTFSAGGGSVSIATLPTTRGTRSGFCLFRTFATNGVGAIHFGRLFYSALAQFNLFSNPLSFESDVLFDSGSSGGNTNSLFQIGLLNNNASSNQTAGVYWEYNPAFSTNWVAKCIGSSSISQTTTLTGDLNSWFKLAFRCQGTNSVVFYTNSVAFWTNSTAANMPTAGLYPGAILLNNATNAPGNSASHSVYLDTFKLY